MIAREVYVARAVLILVILTFLGTRGEIPLRNRRHRMHSSLLVSHRGGRVMIDCGLDWINAVWRLRPPPHAIVLTHAHPDHAWGLRNGAPSPVYATRQTWRGIADFPIAQKRVVRQRRPFEVKGIWFEAFAVEHSILAPAVGYRIWSGESGGACLFYVPDVVFIHQRRAALSGVKLYVGDGATIRQPLVRRRGERGENLIGHAPVSAQLTWCRKAGIAQAIITHCGSGIVSAEPQAAAAINELAEEREVAARIAYDGMRISIS